MPVYSVEGKLGTGKTKFAVWRAALALMAGRRVASNVDLVLNELVPRNRCSYIRVPDKPSSDDLVAIGHGNPDSYDEDKNGVLILDELGTWLNARAFADKGRAAVLDFLIHARKLGWDVYLIVQDAGMIDKQVREALIELNCKCLRMDKVRVPIIGGWLNDIFGGRVGYLPRMHLVVARIGAGPNSVVAERWTYRGDWLHKSYDTRQVFRADYPHAAHTVLHPDYFRPLPPKASFWHRVLGFNAQAMPSSPAHKPKLPLVASLAFLPRDDAWRLAKRFATFLDRSEACSLHRPGHR